MTVTFTTEMPVIGHRVYCADGELRSTVVHPADVPWFTLADAHTANCRADGCEYGGVVEPLHCLPLVPVNVANAKAGLLLEALGLPVDPDGGQCDAEDFHARVLLALALAPADAGMPSRVLLPGETAGPFLVADGGPTFIDGGRRPGWLQDHLTMLIEVAEIARLTGQPVSWG
jgi:hypothetical protein